MALQSWNMLSILGWTVPLEPHWNITMLPSDNLLTELLTFVIYLAFFFKGVNDSYTEITEVVHHLVTWCLLFCCRWWSYMFIGVYIVSRIICWRLWKSHEHPLHGWWIHLTSLGRSVQCDCTVLHYYHENVLSWYGKANYLF